jgi:hypothetical protein
MPPDLGRYPWSNRPLDVLEFQERRRLRTQNAAKDRRRLATGEMKLHPRRSPVGQFELLRHVKMIEVLGNGVAHAGPHVQPKIAVPQVIDEDMADDLRLSGGQKRFPAGACGQVDHVVGTHVVQEPGRIGTGHFDLPPIGHIEQHGPLVSNRVGIGTRLVGH